MLAADDAVAPHFCAVRGRKRDGDGIVMHVQAEEQRGAAGGLGGAADDGAADGSGERWGFCGSTVFGSRITSAWPKTPGFGNGVGCGEGGGVAAAGVFLTWPRSHR